MRRAVVKMCVAWYIAREMDRDEIDAHLVAVYGFEVDAGRLGLRVENSDVYGNDCRRFEFTESVVLSLQQHAKHEENQAIDGRQSISLEVRRSDQLRPGLSSAKDREGACKLVAAQTL